MRFKTSKFVKYCLWIFNVIFVFCGIALVTIGILVLSKVSHLKKIPELDFLDIKLIPSIIVILGCFICMVALIGFCGATRQNVCCLTMYSFIMFIVFCIQLALIVYIHLEKRNLEDKFNNKIKEIWDEGTAKNDTGLFKVIEIEFNCCGFEGYREDYLRGENKTVPSSCCGKPDQSLCLPLDYHDKVSCKSFARDFWILYINKILYVGIAIAVIEFLAFTFGCCLAANIRKMGHHY